MFRTTLSRLRVVGLVEGVSFLVLLGIAMPLKYLADFPEAVLVAGWIHGILFVLFLICVAETTFVRRWGMGKIAAALVASVLPFGTFVMHPRWKREEEESAAGPTAQPT